MAKPGWYGVATLHGYFVCNDWHEVEVYLHGHSGVELHKKFSSEKEALSFAQKEHKNLTGVPGGEFPNRTPSMVTPAHIRAGQPPRGGSSNNGGHPQFAPDTTGVDADAFTPTQVDNRLRSALLGQPIPGGEDDSPPW